VHANIAAIVFHLAFDRHDVAVRQRSRRRRQPPVPAIARS